MQNHTEPHESNDMSASGFIGKGFDFLSSNFAHLLPLVLLAALPAILGHIFNYTQDPDATTSTLISFSAFGILSFFATIILSLTVQSYVFHMIRHDKRLPFIEAVEFGLSKAKILIPVVLLTSLYIIFGLILFIIPGIIFAFWYSFSTLVKLDNESLDAKSAMNRSKELFNANRGLVIKLILLVILLTIPVLIVSAVINAALSIFAGKIVTEILMGVLTIAIEAAIIYMYMNINKTATVHTSDS